jgi:peptidoglycan/xylan/chitin deacetylase (PgdA/CDA1 family)
VLKSIDSSLVSVPSPKTKMLVATVERRSRREHACALAAVRIAFLFAITLSAASTPAPAQNLLPRQEASEQASTQNMCWSPAVLASKKGEERIQKGTANSYQLPQGRSPVGYSPIRDRGVVRRVELRSDKKLVALTFDLCEQSHEVAGYQGGIIDFLRENRIKATFFAGGRWILSHRTRAQQLIADRQFEIANHTWQHRNMRLLSASQVAEEVERTQLAYEQVHADLGAGYPEQCVAPGGGTLAERNAPNRLELFRFPFGACSATSLEVVAGLGLRAIQWDVSSGDASPGETADGITRNVLASVRPGSIVLFHANGRGWHTGAALPRIVASLRAQGYEFVTVSELLSEGRPVITPTCYDARPGDTDHYDRPRPTFPFFRAPTAIFRW